MKQPAADGCLCDGGRKGPLLSVCWRDTQSQFVTSAQSQIS